MPETAVFTDPSGEGRPIELEKFTIPDDLGDTDLRLRKVPEPDPYYVDLGMLYRFAQVEQARQSKAEGLVPLHIAVRGHMGTGKDHDIEQFAAAMGLPYFRIPLTGEVRDVTLIGSTHLHGDGKGGTESRWEDGDITRALRGPALLNLSELNAAGAETLFALHGLLDRYASLDLPSGETVSLREDVRVFGTMNPTDIRDYAGTQTLNKAFADRWVIWEKLFPAEEQVTEMIERRYPAMNDEYVTAISRLTIEINASFEATDAGVRVETPLSLRSVLDRIPTGLLVYADRDDPLREAWDEFVLPQVDAYDRDHYETVWNAVVRRGPSAKPFE
ncbi:MAG: MoxR family ATPase [Actinomycetota bacterium]|nr:MoxR family ATPase [Actinomycetota bacterium]